MRTIVLPLLAVFAAACGGETPPPQAPPLPPAPVVAPPTAPSAPADPPPVVEGDVTLGSVQGMPVLVRRVAGAEFATAVLVLRGGARNWTKGNAGIEAVALDVATQGGTTKLAKAAFHQKLASLGADLWGGAGDDYSTLGVRAPLSAWDEAFGQLADVAVAPAMPASEIELALTRAVQDRKHALEDGDGRVNRLARHLAFAGHPYDNAPEGEVESLSAIKPADVVPYLSGLRQTSRWVLVVAGDVDPGHVMDLARASFAGVPRGAYAETPVPPVRFEAPHLAGDSFKLPTNYVIATMPGPSSHDDDFAATRLAYAVLGHRMFEEVRTRRNLSYAVAAWLDWNQGAPAGHLYVTAVDPTTTLKVMTDELRRMQTELVSDRELTGTKAVFATSEARRAETSTGIAYTLADAYVVGGDWHVATTLPAKVRAATAQQVQAAAKKWMVNLQTAIVGDPGKLDPAVVGAVGAAK